MGGPWEVDCRYMCSWHHLSDSAIGFVNNFIVFHWDLMGFVFKSVIMQIRFAIVDRCLLAASCLV